MKNTNKIIFWVTTVILILWEGVMPLSTVIFAPDQVNTGTASLGYPDYFAYALITCKILGVIAISYPKTPPKIMEWAYAGLTFNLIFAMISHACVDKNMFYIAMPLVFLIILIFSYKNNRVIQNYTK